MCLLFSFLLNYVYLNHIIMQNIRLVTRNTISLKNLKHHTIMVLWVLLSIMFIGRWNDENSGVFVHLWPFLRFKYSFIHTHSIAFSGLEPRHTVHVYGVPSSSDMTMEPFGLAQDTLCDVCVCVCASVCVWVPSCLHFQVVYVSGQKLFSAKLWLLKCVVCA